MRVQARPALASEAAYCSSARSALPAVTRNSRACLDNCDAQPDLLVANGAEVNAKNTAGLTPLELADEKAAELLRRHGGKSAVKLGALSDDAANGNIESVKQHLAGGADAGKRSGGPRQPCPPPP